VLDESARVAGVHSRVSADSGGKQVRPAVLLLTARLFGADRTVAVKLAAIVELIHAASLIHDDVIDDADTRRGEPTVLRRIGAADAVLLGDVIFTAAFARAAALRRAEYVRELARAARRVCAGEVRQNRAKGNMGLTLAQYTRIVELKTASLYRACAVLGAITGGAPRRETGAAGLFGYHLGLGFQAADDLLDVAGDPKLTGKPRGQDLAQGKVTLPLLFYLRALSPAARRRVREGFASDGPGFVAEILDVLRRSPVVPAARKAAAGHCRDAAAQLRFLPGGPEKKSLAALCSFAADRKR
jgi:octaprenyl-diphosphate synthase